MTTPFGETSYEYDLLDRIVRVVDRNGYATTYEYDASSRALQILDSSGYLTGDEIKRTKKVLTAAALTYVATAQACLCLKAQKRLIDKTNNE